MFSFRYFCTSSDNRLAWRNGMGWGWCWGWAGSVSPLTGVGAGLERVHEAIKLGWEKSRANKQSDVLDRAGYGVGEGEGSGACQLYRQTVGLTEFQLLLLLLLLSCFYCHRIIEAASKVESRRRRSRRRRHKSNSHIQSWHLLRVALWAGAGQTDLRFCFCF